MNEDIIPITYMSGTGGNFLCHFILSAKNNNKNNITFSKYGNAHHGLKDGQVPGNVHDSDIDKIKNILDVCKNKINFYKNKVDKPFYVISHIRDIKLLSMYFKRFIRITYELDDVDELAKVFLAKAIVEPSDSVTKTFMIPQLVNILNEQSEYFKHVDGYEYSIFVSWKNLYHDDPSILVEKLHNFTNIPKENFSVNLVSQWRIATNHGINYINTSLKELGEL
jgi:hypothetical protein